MKKFLPAIILFFVFVSTTVQAQVLNCTQTLRLASATYDQGRLHELEHLLSPCLENNNFTAAEKVTAYKFLILGYIYLEEPEKADATMLKLLQTDHYFEINEEVDPAEFIALYRTFRTTPVYRLGVKAGAIATQPNVASGDEVTNGSSAYKLGIGFSGGVAAEIPLKNTKFALNPELNLQLKSFKYSNVDENQFTITATQALNYISLPISMQYYFLKNKDTRFGRMNPYISAGISTDYLLSSSLKLQRKRGENRSIEEKSVKLAPQRENINVSGIVSAGLKFKVTGGFAVVEVRYKYGITNVNNKTTSFENQPLLFDYHYVDGIFKLNSLSISIGYMYNFFDPEKLKIKR